MKNKKLVIILVILIILVLAIAGAIIAIQYKNNNTSKIIQNHNEQKEIQLDIMCFTNFLYLGGWSLIWFFCRNSPGFIS